MKFARDVWTNPGEWRGRTRILFVGWPESSHTHSWINLVQDAKFDARLFALPTEVPPRDWKVKTYLTPLVSANVGVYDPLRRRVYPRRNPVVPFVWMWEISAGRYGFLPRINRILVRATRWQQSDILEKSIAHVVDSWSPDIVHTLGFEPASYVFAAARKYIRRTKKIVWVAQVRGGPDFVLYRHLPGYEQKIREVLRECDQFIADNEENYSFAVQMGLEPRKISSLGVVPGTGGIDVANLSMRWDGMPSQRARQIVWPKAYEAPSSKALPVLEAIKLVWEDIKPCQIYLFWAIQPEVRMWLQTLPEEIRQSCHVYDKMPRDFVLSSMVKARVMLAPSLTDGVPNTMMEAMASGALPIVSPLNTITPVVKNETNVLFARNLYPEEIAAALSRAMNDDTLVDDAAKRNLELVKRIADRQGIQERLNGYYGSLVSKA